MATNQQQPWVPGATAPESLISAIEIIYDDKRHTADERADAYGRLLAPDFRFAFQQVDWVSAGAQSWGYEEELEAHRCLFEKLAQGTFYSLQLDILFSHAMDFDPPVPGRKEIFASTVFLELLNDPNNGWVVNGGQADFLVYLLRDRWVIGGWGDLPRPRLPGGPPTVDSRTWGQVKLASCP